YGRELQKAMQLQQSLVSAISACSDGRKELKMAKQDLTYSSLRIVANYKRRDLLRQLFQELLSIKQLKDTESQLKDLLEFEEDFPAAIRLCLQAQQQAQCLSR